MSFKYFNPPIVAFGADTPQLAKVHPEHNEEWKACCPTCKYEYSFLRVVKDDIKESHIFVMTDVYSPFGETFPKNAFITMCPTCSRQYVLNNEQTEVITSKNKRPREE